MNRDLTSPTEKKIDTRLKECLKNISDNYFENGLEKMAKVHPGELERLNAALEKSLKEDKEFLCMQKINWYEKIMIDYLKKIKTIRV